MRTKVRKFNWPSSVFAAKDTYECFVEFKLCFDTDIFSATNCHFLIFTGKKRIKRRIFCFIQVVQQKMVEINE